MCQCNFIEGFDPIKILEFIWNASGNRYFLIESFKRISLRAVSQWTFKAEDTQESIALTFVDVGRGGNVGQ